MINGSTYIAYVLCWDVFGGLKMRIKVEQRSEFGKIRFYAMEKMSLLFLSLMKRKSFTVAQVKYMSENGIDVEVVHPSSPLLPEG